MKPSASVGQLYNIHSPNVTMCSVLTIFAVIRIQAGSKRNISHHLFRRPIEDKKKQSQVNKTL